MAGGATPGMQAGKEPEFVLGPVRLHTSGGFDYLYVSATTKMEDLGKTVMEPMGKAFQARDEAKAAPVEGMVFRFLDSADGSPAGNPLVVQVGFPVLPGAQPGASGKVERLGEFRAVSVLLWGSLQQMGQAYAALDQAIKEQGLEPAYESREAYLHWEADDSPNNITLVQFGVEA